MSRREHRGKAQTSAKSLHFVISMRAEHKRHSLLWIHAADFADGAVGVLVCVPVVVLL